MRRRKRRKNRYRRQRVYTTQRTTLLSKRNIANADLKKLIKYRQKYVPTPKRSRKLDRSRDPMSRLKRAAYVASKGPMGPLRSHMAERRARLERRIGEKIPAYEKLRRMRICYGRMRRRITLFSLRKIGTGKGVTPDRKISPDSKIKC